MKKVVILGAGFSSLSAAAVLAHENYDVHIIEKNDQAGGRCREWQHQGFTFDMGPSWYWMPDVFESFYTRFNHKASDFYDLVRLDPSYEVIYKDDAIKIPANFDAFKQMLEKIEPGAGKKADQFFKDAQYKYEVGMQDLVYKPSFSLFEFADSRIAKSTFRLKLFSSLEKEVNKLFKNPKIRELFQFPVLFLGAKPSQTPALYSLMNYADTKLGTWYPMGGMVRVSQAFEKIAREQGVHFHYGEEVEGFYIENKQIAAVITNKQQISDIDIVVSGADYHHTEKLLPEQFQSYTDDYWSSRKLSPSALLFYVGIEGKVPALEHHNLFFDADFAQHSEEIYDAPQWPEEPLFYVCVPSKTDPSVAPANKENLFLLMPIAPDLFENEDIHEHYFNLMIQRIENHTNQSIADKVLFKRSFGVQDFKEAYHSFKGNAYGLANTLDQTAILKPKMRSKRLKNLFYCGQLTVPGPGVPPSIISGQVIADYIRNKF